MTRLAIVALAAALTLSAGESTKPPWIDRLEPFGAARGETVEVTFVGERLPVAPDVVFDTDKIGWVETLSADSEAIRGRVRVGADAPLGPRLITLRGPDGRSNTRLFYVDALPSASEAEPNDLPAQAQSIELRPQVLHGALPELPDRDYYRFSAKAGERWTFDVRSIEYGGFLESELALLNADGSRVAFNDDRDDYLETPFLEHRFESDGDYLLKVDQYRGPQRVNCAKNCGYMLRFSQTRSSSRCTRWEAESVRRARSSSRAAGWLRSAKRISLPSAKANIIGSPSRTRCRCNSRRGRRASTSRSPSEETQHCVFTRRSRTTRRSVCGDSGSAAPKAPRT